jgi:alcohol dehydrogenase YqhD (iron-dependent ADH family)
MFGFDYFAPTKVLFGKDTEGRAGELVKEFGGKKVLIHYGGQSAVRSGLLERIKASLDKAGIAYVQLGGVVPNPHLSKVREGIELCKAENVDFILAVGGGSVIDSSKAIAYGLAEPDKNVWDLFAHIREAEKCLPVARTYHRRGSTR